MRNTEVVGDRGKGMRGGQATRDSGGGHVNDEKTTAVMGIGLRKWLGAGSVDRSGHMLLVICLT